MTDWKVILTEHEIEHFVQKCADIINDKFKGEKIVVACILKGAVYFHVDLTRKLTIPHSSYFIEASSYKDGQESGELEILSVIHPSKFEGKKVVLLDELFDNGKTLNRVKQKLHEKANVPLDDIFTCTLFKKNKCVSEPLPNLYGISIPDVWVVGYGLDDKQEKRNWTTLYGCPKIEGIPKTKDDVIFDDNGRHQEWRYDVHAIMHQ